MMNFKNAFLIIIGFSIIISTLLAIIYAFKFFINTIQIADPSIVVALITASATVLAASFTVVIGQRITKEREIAAAHRTFKTKMYSDFIDFTINFTFGQAKADREAMSQKELEEYFLKLSKDFTLWASPEVINAWTKFRNQSNDNSASDTLSNVDDIYRAMREDLGNSNSGLQKKSLINLYISHSS